ncbi:MAG: hypothetical protein GXY82_11320 [Methanospirillum sp.]|nr:hypothetical protein [Methanospirillum sp.]
MLCASCKGRGFCGLARCPITARFHSRIGSAPVSSYMGAAPSVFVGSHGYPAVQGGPLLLDDTDRPPDWLARGLSIEDVVNLRAGTISARAPVGRVQGAMAEVALSQKPVDVEVAFSRPVDFDLRFDGVLTPVGRSGPVRRLDVLDNPVVPRAVERVSSDTDLPASEGLTELYRYEVDVYHLADLLAAGTLGKAPRVVPTRWAITAVDDTLGRARKREIVRYPAIEEVLVFGATLYGNTIAVLLAPGGWQYEMVECWRAHSLWTHDHDSVTVDSEGKRKSGYSPIAGAYYSARLAVTDYLALVRRQARALVLRSVSGEYWAPLGTWVVREAARQAMRSPPERFATLAEGAAALDQLYGDASWREKSTLLPRMRAERTLSDFF